MKKTKNINDALRFSRFCHIVPRGKDRYVLFHSLNMEIVFLVKGFSRIIDYFKDGKTASFVLDEMSLSKDEEKVFMKLINVLVNYEMLIPVKMDETVILERYIANNLQGPAINLMYLILTDKCNYACTYCYVENPMEDSYKFSYMTLKMAKKRIDDFAMWSKEKKSDNKSILFYGGEPLMNKSVFIGAVLYIKKLIKENLLPENTDISIITNGSLIDENIAKFIYDNNVKVGISIDGKPECNDACRKFAHGGGGTFNAVFAGYKKLIDAGLDNIGISFTVGYHNVDNLVENTKFVLEKFSVKSLGYNILMDSENSIIATKEYAKKAADKIIECFEYLRDQGIYEDRVMRKVEFFMRKKVYPNDCAACGRQFVALPNGKIGPCQAFMGSKKYFIKKDKDFSPYNNKMFQDWSRRSPLLTPRCYDCISLGLCGGGCPCRAHIRSGDIWAIDEIFCYHSKRTVEWIINDFAKKNNI